MTSADCTDALLNPRDDSVSRETYNRLLVDWSKLLAAARDVISNSQKSICGDCNPYTDSTQDSAVVDGYYWRRLDAVVTEQSPKPMGGRP